MIDLHMHSLYSDDGEFTPAELARKCREAGITVMALADHNTARGNREAEEAAKRLGIRYIPGIEIDCTWQGIHFHVLGYGIDHTAPAFLKIEEQVNVQSRQASMTMLKKTRELGFSVTKEEMEAVSAGCYWKDHWTGEMFAEVLLNKEAYRDHEALLPYRPGGGRGDNPYVNFYWDYYSQGRPCHAPIHYPEMEEVLEIIHGHGGIAVLAHPGANLRGRERLFPQVMAAGLDGAEALSSYHTEEQTAYFCRETKALGKYITCGSDFHGKTKPQVRLGGIKGIELYGENVNWPCGIGE